MGRPGGWIRPLSRIAIRSWTHSSGFRGVDLGQQEPRPAAVARMRGEQLGEGGAGAARAERQRHRPAPGGTRCGSAGPERARDGSAGDQRQASCHTTHNVFVLLLFLSRDSAAESMARLGRDSLALPGSASISRTTRARRLARNAERHVACSRARPPCRARRRARAPSAARSARPCATRSPACGTGGLSVMRGIGGSSTLCRAIRSYSRQTLFCLRVAGEGRAERHHRAHPFGHRARQLAREQPAEAPADHQHRPSSLDDLVEPLPSAARSVSARAPQLQPHLPAVNPPARLGERPAQRHRRAVVRDETRDDQRRRTVAPGPTRPATRPNHAPAAAASSQAAFASRRQLGGGRSSHACTADHAVQRNSPPISSCSALGSRTRPSAV